MEEEEEDNQFCSIEFPDQYDDFNQKRSDKPSVSPKIWRERGTLCEEIMNELVFAPRIWMRASFPVQCRLWEALRSRCRIGHPDRALIRQRGHGVQRLMEVLRDYYRVPPAGFDQNRRTTITVFYSPSAPRASNSTMKEGTNEVATQRCFLTRDEILTLRGLLLECVMALMEDFSLSQASSNGVRVLQVELDAIHGLIHNELARATLERERNDSAAVSPSKHERKYSRKVSEEVSHNRVNLIKSTHRTHQLVPSTDRVRRREL